MYCIKLTKVSVSLVCTQIGTCPAGGGYKYSARLLLLHLQNTLPVTRLTLYVE